MVYLVNVLDYFGFMRQQHSPSFTFTRHGGTARARFVASEGRAAAKSIRSFIPFPDFLPRTLVLGLILISILR